MNLRRRSMSHLKVHLRFHFKKHKKLQNKFKKKMHVTLQLMVHSTMQSRIHLWISSRIFYMLYRAEQTELLTFSNEIQEQTFTGIIAVYRKSLFISFLLKLQTDSLKKTPPEIFSGEIAYYFRTLFCEARLGGDYFC